MLGRIILLNVYIYLTEIKRKIFNENDAFNLPLQLNFIDVFILRIKLLRIKGFPRNQMVV